MLWFSTLCYNTHLIFKALLRSRFYTFDHKEQGGISKMTGTTTALGLLERLARASVYWIDMVA